MHHPHAPAPPPPADRPGPRARAEDSAGARTGARADERPWGRAQDPGEPLATPEPDTAARPGPERGVAANPPPASGGAAEGGPRGPERPASPGSIPGLGAVHAAARGDAPAVSGHPGGRRQRAVVPAPRRMPERFSVRAQVLDELRAALLAGELPPGSVHSAPELGARYGVSATPVREAMQLLAQEGAVEVLPNRGFRVARHTERDVAQLARVRLLLEAPTVADLAGTVRPARWDELRPYADATTAAAAGGDRADYAEADRAFHRELLGLAGNPHLVTAADALHRRAQWAAVAALPAARRPAPHAHAAHHAALLTALGAGAPTEALLRAHLAVCP